MSATVHNIAETVCENLPEGWVISLNMEQGAAWVCLENPDDKRVPFDDIDVSLAQAIRNAVDVARNDRWT